jgi:hypothetical protein
VVIIVNLQLEVVRRALLDRRTSFDTVTIIRQEPLSIIELDLECLVVEGHPASLDVGALTALHVVELSADLGSGRLVITQLYLINLFVCELEPIVLVDQLQLVRLLVCADTRRFIKIHIIRICADVEVPGAARLAEAAHRLIGPGCAEQGE